MYQGGSGGFICAHLILQSQCHFAVFLNAKPCPESKAEFLEQFSQVVKDQWNIIDSLQWKSNEVWMDNQATSKHSIDGLNRFYHSCNPTWQPVEPLPPLKTNVLIYTDLTSQFDLSLYKRSYWFSAEPNDYESLEQNWNSEYSKAKDAARTTVKLHEIEQLSADKQKQLLAVDKNFDIFFQWAQHRNSALTRKQYILSKAVTCKINNVETVVDPRVASLLPMFEHAIKLQDIILSNGRYLTDLLELPWNSGHADLIKKWISLHPPELIKQILS